MAQDSREINISRVINAEKWRILRMLSRVEDFPEFMPNVKEASVVSKKRNVFTTRWRIEIDGIPIRWTEEDIFEFPKAAISFKSVQGDMAYMAGRWNLSDCAEGTLVELSVKVEVGIPAIQQFTEPYVQNLICKNFEAMLEAVDNRLISMRYASFKKGNENKVAGFAVIGHFYNTTHLIKSLHMLNQDFKIYSKDFMERLFNMTPSFKMYDLKEFRSKTGVVTRGCFIVCTFMPDVVEANTAGVYSKVVNACRVAEKYGAGIVSLGGFTSVVGERYGHKISNEVDIPVTTGNTLTAALAVEGVLKAARLLDIDLRKAKVAVIGGTGDIGSACSRAMAARKVRHLVVTGRTKSNLRKAWLELKLRYGARRVEATSDNIKAAADADIVIAAAAVSASILDTSVFKPGAVICDLGYPKNISYNETSRRDILIFSGGMAKLPQPLDTGIDMGLPSCDITYGCFSEAIVLALQKRYENYSEGRGRITLEKMQEIMEIAKGHGFELSPFYWGHRLLGEDEIARIKNKKNV